MDGSNVVSNAVNQAVSNLRFKGVTAAAKHLAQEKGIDLMNARDCIYKSLRKTNGKAGKTHGYITSRDAATREVILTPVQPKA